MPSDALPPIAPPRPTVLRHHGDERVDDWYWLRERDNPEVIAYLEAENAYTKAATAHTEQLQQKLYDEIVGRIQETDTSAPVPKGAYRYYVRTVEGEQYGIHCRASREGGGAERVLLDENSLAAGHEYFAVGNLEVSPDHRLLAYATDVSGGERFTLGVRELETGEDRPDVIEDTYYGLAWAADSATLFYTRPDAAMRPWQVWRHRLGTPVSDDVLVLQEDDDRFFVEVGLSRTEDVVLITSESKVTTETHVIDAHAPAIPPRLVQRRRQGIEYFVSHHRDGRLFVLTNDEAENFRVMAAPVDNPGRDQWTEVVPHRPDVRVESIEVFARHLVLLERAEALLRIRVIDLGTGADHVIDQPEPVYSAWPGANLEFDASILRYEYTSLVTPRTTYDYDLDARRRRLVKRQPVLGGYDPDGYETVREWAEAGDGARVPISVVYRKGLERDGRAPAVLSGYGSYEHSIDPSFSSLRVSLLDRGVVLALAHVRGGGELGRRWYEEGKLTRKRNTFVDFIACAERLVELGYTSPDRLVARGGSAGGLLMGAVANLRPDLFRAMVADVPFVDALTTILDESLPLTITEWEEWGNPVEDPDVYAYMKSYAPYDNVEAKDYPALLVTAGLNDPRVQYWEPAKWVAKLRAIKTDDNPLLLKTEMGAGHGGPSGRYDAWRDDAFAYAFVLDALGITS